MMIEQLVDAKAIIGEGPVWDEQNLCLYWVDILGGLVHRYDRERGQDEQVSVGEMVGAVVLRPDGSLVGALRDGFYSIDWNTGSRTLIWRADQETGNRFNDGKCDPDGRFWAGTMSLTGRQGSGSLYCLATDRTVHRLLSDVTISNGLAWSQDRKTVYYIDTPSREVWAFDYDRTGYLLQNKRVAVRIADDEGRPDGMSIDVQGRLWVAQWGGSRVACYDPENGAKVTEVLFPVEQVSSCAFGGPDLDELYVTTAWNNLPDAARRKQPQAGALYRVKTETRGYPADRFLG